MKTEETISLLNQRLIEGIDKIQNIDLGFGKTGIAIYLFHLSKITHNEKYTIVAKSILDEIVDKVDSIYSDDIINGIAGIGIAANHLIVNNFVRGDINTILHDIDNRLFRNLLYSKYYNKYTISTQIQLLYYFTVRLRIQKKNSELDYLYKEIIIHTINNIYLRIDTEFYAEPLSYCLDYPLPLFLYTLGEIYDYNFYNTRIQRIIEEMSYRFLYLLPYQHSNKLLLMFGLNNIRLRIQMPQIAQQVNILKATLDPKIIFESELEKRSIYLYDGIAGICLLLNQLEELSEIVIPFDWRDYFNNKIILSEELNHFINDNEYFLQKAGLLRGYCGIALTYIILSEKRSVNIK